MLQHEWQTDLAITVTRTEEFDLLAILTAHEERNLCVLVILLTELQLGHAVKQLRQVFSDLPRNKQQHLNDPPLLFRTYTGSGSYTRKKHA